MRGPGRDDRKYSRVYHDAVDDEKFAAVWDNDARLSLWVRMLVIADANWPASAQIPRATKRHVLLALVDCGLIDLRPGDRYRIHGLDPERQERSERAAYAAQSRWDASRNARSNASRNADAMPKRDEHKREETRRASGAQARRNTVDSDPHLTEFRDAIRTTHGNGLDDPTVEPLPLRRSR